MPENVQDLIQRRLATGHRLDSENTVYVKNRVNLNTKRQEYSMSEEDLMNILRDEEHVFNGLALNLRWNNQG